MDYLTSWMFTSSYSSNNSRSNLRPVGSPEFDRVLHAAGSRSRPLTTEPHAPRLDEALQTASDRPFVSLILEQLTAQIIEAFDQIRFERDATPRASAAWQKLTGEMLAYARVAALLENMKCGSPPVSNSEE
jgi:hypothetical protein